MRRAFVIASGPSVTAEALELVRAAEGLKIAVNSSIFSAPWADICFAMDNSWWHRYRNEVKALPCERWSSSLNCGKYGVKVVKKNPRNAPLVDGVSGNNSGAQAAEFAYLRGADEIILLGVDCKSHEGRAHHHEDHPKPMSNPVRTDHWSEDWARIVSLLDARIINTSTICDLDCFEYRRIEDICGDR